MNMENLNLEGSAITPTVNFHSDNGVLELKGRSIPENSIEFYKPLASLLHPAEDLSPMKTESPKIFGMRAITFWCFSNFL